MFMLPVAFHYVDWSLFLLRLMVALVFGASGFGHLKAPRERAKDIGMSVGFTVFLGAAELAGALGLVFGVLTQWAAIGLILLIDVYKRQLLAQMTTPEIAQAQAASSQTLALSPQGHAGSMAVGFAGDALFLLFFAVAGGALGARIMARARRPEV